MSDSSCQKLADQAWELVGRGDLENARNLFSRICELDANNAEAVMMIGTICGESGQLDDATKYLERAINMDPEYADAYLALAKIQQSKGDHSNALGNARKATELDAGYPEAWATLGAMYGSAGSYADAESASRKALALNPDLVEAHVSLANAVMQLGKFEDADQSYIRALQLQPGNAEVKITRSNLQLHLGKIAQMAGNVNPAVTHYQTAIQLDKGNAEAHALMGMLQMQQGQLAEAGDSIDCALAVQSDLSIALFYRGLIAYKNGNLTEAVADFRKALEKSPDNIEALINLALALQDNYRLEEARKVYEHLLGLLAAAPAAAISREHRANLHYNYAKILRSQGMPEESVAAYREALVVNPDHLLAGSSLLHTLHYLPGIDPGAIYKEHLQWCRTHLEVTQKAVAHGDSPESRRLRVGYVSPDLRRHSVAYFFEPLLRNHDVTKFEVFCYSDAETPDEMTDRLQGLSEHWCSTRGMDNDSMVTKIEADGIDILVDLAGHTKDNRLQVFARRPARVQVTYLGYPDTTGLSTMDFRVTDEWADPKGDSDSLNSEKLLRLPRPFLCYMPPVNSPATVTSPSEKAGYITFGSLNNLSKINSDVIDVWVRILKQVPGAHLLLKNFFLGDVGTRERFYDQFQRCGIERERVELYGPTEGMEEHLEFYNRVDIALDTFPYSGATTTCECLWMAVPVVTLQGNLHAGRVGVSILNEVGLNELIADNYDAYVDKVCKLAADSQKLAELRDTLRDRFSQSRLCDGKDMSKAVEAAYAACCSS